MGHNCPVCGYAKLAEPPYDKTGCASFEICPSCGIEFGYHDASKSHADQPDPCLTQKGSALRFAVLTLLFVTMLGGVGCLILFAKRPFGMQVCSMVIYTAAV